MRKGLVLIAILVVAIGTFFVSSKPASELNQPNASDTSFSKIQSAIDTGGQLIDVRTSEEYADSHIQGSVNLSLQDIEAGSLPAGSKDQDLYVYCRSGNRSSQATTILKNAGYTNVNDLGAMSNVSKLTGAVIVQ